MPLPHLRPPSGWSQKTVPHLTPVLLCEEASGLPVGFFYRGWEGWDLILANIYPLPGMCERLSMCISFTPHIAVVQLGK